MITSGRENITMGHDVFVSYSSKDKSVADAVVAALERDGVRCWYAPRDIRAGTDWGESITEAIGECALMLLIFSNNSNASKRVLDEIYFAVSEGKTLLPFRIENLDPSGAMRLHLSSRHWLDAFDPSWKHHIDRLLDAVSVILQREQDAPAPERVEMTSRAGGSRGRAWKIAAGIVAGLIVIIGGYALLNLGDRGATPGLEADPSETLASPPPATTAAAESTGETPSPTTTEAEAEPSPTGTDTPSPPEQTEMPYVEGSVIRAEYDPAAAYAEPDIYEDFEGSDGFIGTTTSAYRSWYRNGVFNVADTRRGWWAWNLGDTPLQATFYVDVLVMHPETCVENDTAGLVLRYDEGSRFGLLVGLSCSDKYWFGFSSGPDFSGSICSVVGPTLSLQGDEDCSGYPVLVQSEWIDTSPNAWNRIGVFAVDTTYTLFINGHEVATVTDVYSPALPASTLPNPYGGFVGLFLGAGQDDLSSAIFDEFSLWNSP